MTLGNSRYEITAVQAHRPAQVPQVKVSDASADRYTHRRAEAYRGPDETSLQSPAYHRTAADRPTMIAT